jgi:hypothetical protein
MIRQREGLMPSTPDTSKPWPHWIIRYMMQDDEETFWDLIWSVGGSPPYGGVKHDEAQAIYNLVENFRGKGMATSAHYDAAYKAVAPYPDRKRVLEAFQLYDEIVSASDSYSLDVANQGLAVAKKIGDDRLIGLFTLFQAGVSMRTSDYAQASKLTNGALERLLDAAEKDPSSSKRAEQAAQNAVALAALAGNKKKATQLLDQLSEVIPSTNISSLRNWLESRP